jgi:hypothetical protein
MDEDDVRHQLHAICSLSNVCHGFDTDGEFAASGGQSHIITVLRKAVVCAVIARNSCLWQCFPFSCCSSERSKSAVISSWILLTGRASCLMLRSFPALLGIHSRPWFQLAYHCPRCHDLASATRQIILQTCIFSFALGVVINGQPIIISTIAVLPTFVIGRHRMKMRMQ